MTHRVALALAFAVVAHHGSAAEVDRLTAENWDRLAPDGKEVDAIYGDYVLRSDTLVAVVGDSVPRRHANVSILNVGGSIIDLTRRDEDNDQLYCYWPFGGNIKGGHYRLTGPVSWPTELPRAEGSATLAFAAEPIPSLAVRVEGVSIVLGYELVDGESFVRVKTLFQNATDGELVVPLRDKARTDSHEVFDDAAEGIWHSLDLYWRGAYGVMALDANRAAHRVGPALSGQNDYHKPPTAPGVVVPAKGHSSLERVLITGPHTLAIRATQRSLQGVAQQRITMQASDPRGPVAHATFSIHRGEEVVGRARADETGRLETRLVPGEYRVTVESPAHEPVALPLHVETRPAAVEAILSQPGYAHAVVTNGTGERIPCKAVFFGHGVDDPDFGPDTAENGVNNCWYTHNGEFRISLKPGQYRVLIGHGPEHDLFETTVDIQPGKTVELAAVLPRSVDTTGWLSADLHSHASESGDSTSSQRGRVLNLLAEHVEFIPCTEHNRVCSYEPHVKALGCQARALPCAGIELSGLPVLLNHQNAFPLQWRPRTQNGGGPHVHPHPVAQMRRLAAWDDQGDKVVQLNHPDVPAIYGDLDRNGLPDEGLRPLLQLCDVMEINSRTDGPALEVFEPFDGEEPGQFFRWVQLLNHGYRIPGVANTDAHRTFHGSGWVRNYVQSATDDPSRANLLDLCHAIERGNVTMTTGPFLTATASSEAGVAGPGEDLLASNGVVELRIRVQCPNWLDVNRVQVFVNGRPDPDLSFRRGSHPTAFGDGTTKCEIRTTRQLTGDAHLIVAAIGEGRNLGSYFGEARGAQPPVAVANPFYIDVDGGGFEPNRDDLGRDLLER